MFVKATRSQRNNLANAAQGTAKKVLCVCSVGMMRSPTAAAVLHKELGFNTRSAGVDLEYALIPVSEALLLWADEIVCMEPEHKHKILKYLKSESPDIEKKIIVLNISDDFEYMNIDLQGLILQRYHKNYRFDKI